MTTTALVILMLVALILACILAGGVMVLLSTHSTLVELQDDVRALTVAVDRTEHCVAEAMKTPETENELGAALRTRSGRSILRQRLLARLQEAKKA